MTDSRPLICIGSGGHAKVLIDTALLSGREVLFCTDCDEARHGSNVLSVPIAGSDDLIQSHSPETVLLVNGIGSAAVPSLRASVFAKWRSLGYSFATIIHPTAIVATSAEISSGVQLLAGSIVQVGCVIQENSIINTRCSVDHDCSIGRDSHLAPGVTLSGGVSVGALCHLGTGATVIQGVTIGEHAVVGAGAVVIRDVASKATVVGVPARAVQSKSQDK